MSGVCRIVKALVLGALLCLVITGAATTARAATYELRADAGTVVLPGSATLVPIWGFADDTGVPSGTNPVTLPGPEIRVPAGDSLTIHLTNNLPVPVSIVFPGQAHTPPPAPINQGGRVRSFAVEAAPGGTATYTLSAPTPGTFLYESGTNPAVQIPMGLHGALIVGDPPAGVQDRTFVWSEIDPALNAAVAASPTSPLSTVDFHPTHFLINGRAYPDQDDVPIVAGAPTYLRLLNAGSRAHAPMISGLYMTILREDGFPVPYPRDVLPVPLTPGKTFDVTVSPSAAGRYVLFDRRLDVTNRGVGPGGMMLVLNAANNVPPAVDAGPDQVVPSPGSPVSLVGSATDADGPLALTLAWEDLSGPAPVAFADPAAPTTAATFPLPGTYVLQLSAWDGLAVVADTVVVTVEAGAPPAAPSGVQVARVSTKSLYLFWTDNANDENGFVVRRRQINNGVTGAWSVLRTVAPNTTSLVDTSAPRGLVTTQWQYGVSAFNGAGSSVEVVSPWIR